MPQKKNKSSSSRSKKAVSRPNVTSSMGPSYDTQMIVTILLLIFIYPVGLIFMWAWMRTWPIWIKIIISLPLIISVFFVMLVLFAVHRAIQDVRYERMMGNYEYRMGQNQLKNIYGTPSVFRYKTY